MSRCAGISDRSRSVKRPRRPALKLTMQMVHPARRTFFDREVFKTSHFCDHPVEDIIERISCQFYVKYVRGRPQAPEYYPGWPICELFIISVFPFDRDRFSYRRYLPLPL